MKKSFIDRFDFIILLSVFVLVSMGILFIYSSAINSEGVRVTNEYIKQIIWAAIGFFIMIFLSFYDYRRIERIALWLYIGLIVILIYTRIFGRYVNGARSWIGIGDFGIQPSEFGKIFYILFLAKYLNESQEENPLKRFAFAVVIMMLPMGLILIQPDMGTASVYLPIFFVMCFFANVKLKYLILTLAFGVGTIFLTILPVWNEQIAGNAYIAITILTNNKLRLLLTVSCLIIFSIAYVVRHYFHAPKYFKWIAYFFAILFFSLLSSKFMGKFLKDYQIMRLIIFMDPNVDPLGAGWNIIQSKIAIGSGNYLGRGYLNGTQSHYRFLPQQSTDFIFSILSEEFGFLGGFIVFVLYFTICTRILRLIRKSSNQYGILIASGLLAMYAFHFFINVGMVMGIMPITGIPLLFLSYGGSSLLTAMTGIGLLMNIYYHKKDLY